MTSPRRLLDTSALPTQLQRALRAAPGAPQPAQLAELASKVGGALGLSLQTPAALGGLASVASKSAWAAGWWVLGGGALGVGLSALAATTSAAISEPTPVPALQSAVTVAIASAAPTARSAPPAPPLPRSSAASGPPLDAPVSPPSPMAHGHQPGASAPAAVERDGRDRTSDAHETELSLLRRAQRFVLTDPSQALALSAAHAQRFPNGTLAQERDIIAVDALLRLNRTAEARTRARAFNERYPGSAHARRLQELLGEQNQP